MLYRFGRFELDLARIELRADGRLHPLEPQVFGLLALLVENRERLVTHDEIIEKVWDGRIVSDSAIASRVKSVRQALGDDGKAQAYIRTIRGHGLRFVAPVLATGDAQAIAPEAGTATAEITRPSIAVRRFHLVGDAGQFAAFAEALPHDLIAELSRLRWLFITARGSSFRLSPADVDAAGIGRLLGVRYCLSGTVEVAGRQLGVTIELADTRDASVVWAERFAAAVDEVHEIRARVAAQVLAALEIRIPLHEASLVRLAVSSDLDAWSAYHLGLQHMYRFNRRDNSAASALFQQAVARDPGFARAHAGLSFVHFQSAFLRYSDDLSSEIALARRHAERGLELDPLDPFVNFTMGRSFWLEGDLDAGLGWLERACTISPNYAQGIYARSWTETLSGRSAAGREHVDLAMRLSPLDPLYYAMLGTRALGHLALGEDLEAAAWAERAARAPGAHVLIAMIATAAHALADDQPRAALWAANVRARSPALTRVDFFRSFPMQSEPARRRVGQTLAEFGF